MSALRIRLSLESNARTHIPLSSHSTNEGNIMTALAINNSHARDFAHNAGPVRQGHRTRSMSSGTYSFAATRLTAAKRGAIVNPIVPAAAVWDGDRLGAYPGKLHPEGVTPVRTVALADAKASLPRSSAVERRQATRAPHIPSDSRRRRIDTAKNWAMGAFFSLTVVVGVLVATPDSTNGVSLPAANQTQFASVGTP